MAMEISSPASLGAECTIIAQTPLSSNVVLLSGNEHAPQEPHLPSKHFFQIRDLSSKLCLWSIMAKKKSVCMYVCTALRTDF